MERSLDEKLWILNEVAKVWVHPNRGGGWLARFRCEVVMRRGKVRPMVSGRGITKHEAVADLFQACTELWYCGEPYDHVEVEPNTARATACTWDGAVWRKRPVQYDVRDGVA